MSLVSREVELKLEASAPALARLKQSPLLRNVTLRSGGPVSLVSVYFDTQKLKLRKKGLTLRVRRVGRRHIQTIKKEGVQGASVLARGEWEHEIAGAQPDLSVVRDTELTPLLSTKLLRGLKPVFETRVRRSVFPIRNGDSEIELAIDEGTIEAGRQSAPLCELELELKRGERTELFELAHKIAVQVPVRLAFASKAERGYALAHEELKAPKAGLIELMPRSSGRAALQSIAWECLRQIVGNERAAQSGDPEGLHQMRVGLRRLRAAISLFDGMLGDPQTRKVVAEIKWISKELGPARELDVFISIVSRAMREDPKGSGAAALIRDIKQRREEALAHACRAIESTRFRGLVLDIAGWVEAGDWTRSANDLVRTLRDQPVMTAAADGMKSCWTKILKRGVKLDRLSPAHRHKLRIQAKKLRYASEFFAGAFPGKKARKRRKALTARLARLQDALGDLNDIAGHERLIERTVSGGNAGGRGNCVMKAFAAGRLLGREEARTGSVLNKAISAYRSFAETRPFWP